MSIITAIDADTKDWILNVADERAARAGCLMDLERAAFAIDWVESNCRLYEGERAGELIQLMPYQREVMVRIFGWVQWSKHFDRYVRRFRKARIWAGKKNGKLLDANTIIPTPRGQCLNGDLVAGDFVLDADGMPTKVVAAHPIALSTNSLRFTFEDGSHIDADASHLWEVFDNVTDSTRVITSLEIASSFSKDRYSVPWPYGRRGRANIRRVQPCDPVEMRCITVASPRQLYLAGPSGIATHNSPWIAAMELYLAFGEGEPGMKVYTGAADGEQAKIAQFQAVQMIKQIPNYEDEYQVYENTYKIKQFSTNSEMTILTSGSERSRKSKEGLNGSVCWDELHVVDANTVRRVSRAGISRAEPIDLAVSTAGLDKNCYGMEQFAYGAKVNSGEIEDDRFFHADWALPENVTDQMFDADPAKYGKMTNPAWGYIIDPDEFLTDYKTSKHNPTEKRLFFVYRLTRWSDSVTSWLDQTVWDSCGETYTWDSLKGRECFAGLDLSKTKDMTSLVLTFPFDENGKTIFRLWPFFWLPEDRIEHLSLSYPFKQWVAQGFLIPTKGARVGFVELKNSIRKIAKQVEFRELLYDRWKAEELTQELCEGEHDESGRTVFEPIGCERTEVGQGVAKLSEPTMTFEHHLLGQDIRHPNNLVLNWQASHVEVYTDPNGNIKPVKPKDQEYTGKSVDGIFASIMSVAGAVRAQASQPRIWSACPHTNILNTPRGRRCAACGEEFRATG